MKHTIPILALCAGTALFAAGCSKTDDAPLPRVGHDTQSSQGSMSTPVLPSRPLPDPATTKSADAPATAPAAGATGDTANPASTDAAKTNKQ